MKRAVLTVVVVALVTALACGATHMLPSGTPAPMPAPPPVHAFTRVLVHARGIVTAGQAASADDAVALSGATIAAIGTSADLAARCTGACVLMDVSGSFIAPGFHDAHVHLVIAGEEAAHVAVHGSDVAVIQKALRSWMADHPEAPWIIAQGVNLGAFTTLPTKADLDAVEKTRPVVVRDTTLHNVWVNSAALAVAGITSATTIPGGRVVHDASGEPTGVLFDFAARPIIQKEPKLDAEALKASILAAQKKSLAAGYTATQGGPVSHDEANAFVALDAAGALAQHTFLWAPLGGSDADFRAWVDFARGLPKDGHVHIVAFKGFVDGTLVARTAALLAPYADDPTTRGALVYSPAALRALVVRANRGGFPVALHAVGDHAVREALDAFEASKRALGSTPINRVEHASIVDPVDLPRFAGLGVVASVQPTFMLFRNKESALFLTRVGAERSASIYPFRSLADAGATLAFGTDFPVGGLGEAPGAGMFCAIRREFTDGTPFEPAQRIGADAALEAYTATPARIIGWGDRLGRVAVGYEADLVLLDDDPRHAGATKLAASPPRGVLVTGVPR